MRLTKYGHSCLLVEEGPARLLLDPGTLSGGFEELEGLTAVLVTHQHGDHLDLQRPRMLLDRNPGARVLCDEGSAEQLAAAGAAVEVVHDGEELEVGGVAVRVAGATTRSSTPTSRWSPTSATWWAGGGPGRGAVAEGVGADRLPAPGAPKGGRASARAGAVPGREGDPLPAARAARRGDAAGAGRRRPRGAVVPLQNRVTPTGEIVADLGRGLLMGNRGCLHGPDRRLGVARWRSKLWICCVLDWKGVRRDPMPPGRWTALFFVDEATALAAGHRPCAYCRRADFVAFAEAWRGAHRLAQRPRAAEIDARLHAERVDPRSRRQVTRPAVAGELPDGVMVRAGGTPGLLAGGALLPWTFAGYRAPVPPPAATAHCCTRRLRGAEPPATPPDLMPRWVGC